MSRAERGRSGASSRSAAPSNPSPASPPRPPPKSTAPQSKKPSIADDTALQLPPHLLALAANALVDPSAPDLNAAPESLDAIKPRDWSFVEEEQARKQASGASKRRKDPLQKSDMTAGGRLPSIDHSALYATPPSHSENM